MSVCLKLRSSSSDSSATASSEEEEAPREEELISLLGADRFIEQYLPMPSGCPYIPVEYPQRGRGSLSSDPNPSCVHQTEINNSTNTGDAAETDSRRYVAETNYRRYVAEYVVDTLKEDSYFTGYLAATAKCKTFGQRIHAMFTIAVLLFSIFCQAGMICFMRLEQHQEEPDFTDLVFYAKLFVLQTEHISSNVSPGLLFLGITTFLMQVAAEQKQVYIYRRAINLVDPKRKWCSFVTMLQIAKITMPFAMRVVGIHVLSSSTSNMDVILNCTALTFVFSLDDIAMLAACPCMSRAMHAAQNHFMFRIEKVEVEPLSSWSSAWQAIATFICCICFGALVEYVAETGFELYPFTSSSQ